MNPHCQIASPSTPANALRSTQRSLPSVSGSPASNSSRHSRSEIDRSRAGSAKRPSGSTNLYSPGPDEEFSPTPERIPDVCITMNQKTVRRIVRTFSLQRIIQSKIPHRSGTRRPELLPLNCDEVRLGIRLFGSRKKAATVTDITPGCLQQPADDLNLFLNR